MTTELTLRTATAADLPPLGWVARPDRPWDPKLWRDPSPWKPDQIKPLGGLWSSPIGPDGLTAWQRWCELDEYDGDWGTRLARITPAPEARVVVVDSHADLTAAIARYVSKRPEVSDPLLERLLWTKFAAIDFAEMAKDFDAFWLTRAGEYATRFNGLYGWDCETVFWLRPTFEVDHDLDAATAALPRES